MRIFIVYFFVALVFQASAFGQSCESKQSVKEAVQCLEKKLDEFKTSALKRDTPVGTVIDYAGPIESDSNNPSADFKRGYRVWAKANKNWVACNGATLAEGTYDSLLKEYDNNPASGLQVPNLVDKFTKGVTYDDIGKTGGQKENTIDLSHSHDIQSCGGANGRNALQAQAWIDGGVPSCNERSSASTAAKLAPLILDNEPPFFGVIKLIKINK